MLEPAVLTGVDDRCIDYASCEVPVHRDLVSHVAALRERAAEAGFELALASGYRNFERQLAIWNAKAAGHRPLLGDDGERLDPSQMTEEKLLFAILRWSALPGASRHHWGTDIDVYDAAPCRAGYRLQLTYEETEPCGVFGGFHEWLAKELKQPRSAWFRPYQKWTGGVAPEPWHLSFAPLSEKYQGCMSLDALECIIQAADIALKDVIVARLEEIFDRYVRVDWGLYPYTQDTSGDPH